LLQLAKTLCLSYFAYIFSSTKLEIRAEQVLPGCEEVRGKKKETEWRAVGRNSPNNVCKCE
jgi:hypothetical protein